MIPAMLIVVFIRLFSIGSGLWLLWDHAEAMNQKQIESDIRIADLLEQLEKKRSALKDRVQKD